MTERDLLDLLHARYSAESMGARRYVVAEHVSNRPSYADRIADAIVQDCYRETVTRAGRRYTGNLWQRGTDGEWVPRADLVSRRMLHGHEVKVSRGDWLRELRDPTKADTWRQYCDRWWLVAPAGVARPDELPTGWGLLVPVGRVLRAVVPAPVLDPQPMPPDTRAALLRATFVTATRRLTP